MKTIHHPTAGNPDDQEQEKFEIFYAKYASSIYGLIYRAVRSDAALAEHLTRESFVTVFNQVQHHSAKGDYTFAVIFMAVKKLLKENGYLLNEPSLLIPVKKQLCAEVAYV